MAQRPYIGQYGWGQVLLDHLAVELSEDGTLKNVARPSDISSLQNQVNLKANASNVYSKAEVDSLLQSGGGGGGGGVVIAQPAPTILTVELESEEEALVVMPFNGEITGWSLIGDDEGDAEVDIRISGFGVIPGSGNSVVGTTPPALDNAQFARNINLANDWQPEFSAGDIMALVANSFTTVTKVTLALHLSRIGTSGVIPIVDAYRDMILQEPDLVAYWPLDDAQGSTFRDALGTHHGTISDSSRINFGQPSLLPIGGGTCMAISPTSGTAPIMEVAHHADLSIALADDFTVECWMQNYGGPSEYRTVVGKGEHDQGDREFRINITSSRDLRATVYTSSGSVHVNSTVNVADEALHHCVIVKDGTSVYFDVDGVRFGPGTITGDVIDTEHPFVLGSWVDGTSYYRGYLQHVAVYHRAFTEADSQSHYQFGMGAE